jgi:hypothetical protein
MRHRQNSLYVLIVVSMAYVCSASAESPTQGLSPGLTKIEDNGAPGYQHSLERSRFAPGLQNAEMRHINEAGFAKVVGTEGVFATNLHNGLVVALQSGGADKGDDSANDGTEKPSYLLDPQKHNEQVLDYFVTAGIPRDQIGGVHANTYLSSSGSTKDERPTAPKVDGYASILERKVEKYPVLDSVAWARMDDQGKVISEWVYWPAIPGKVLADARRLEEQLSSRKTDFLARLPSGLPSGRVVIRHSSATEEGPFEVYATYDVLERKESARPARDKSDGDAKLVSVIVRHFDVNAEEIRLPQERRTIGGDFPPK